MRITLAVAVACLTLGGLAAAGDATAAIRKQTDIPPEGLGPALNALAKDRNFQIVYVTEQIANVRTQGASGAMTAAEALEHVLSGTGLTYKYLDDKTVTIMPVGAAAPSSSSEDAEKGNKRQGGDQKKSFWDHFRLAQATPSSNSGLSPQSSVRSTQLAQSQVSTGPEVKQQQEKQQGIPEIIVTARKRAENVEDVPLSITVKGADEISARQLVNAADYLRDIPGVNQVEGGYGGQAIVIRGINTDTSFQNASGGPTTANYFGETPTTNSAGYLGSSADLKLVDIERVEVLRGPQGTSFGNASLGGAVRILPVAPNLHQFEGKVAAGYSQTSGFGGNNDNLQGVLNVPLIEGKLAIRAVAYEFSDSGYYRNVAGSNAAFQANEVVPYGAQASAIDQARVGDTNTKGARIAALFQARDDLKFTLTYVSQTAVQNGWPLSTTATPYEQTLFQVAPENVLDGQYGGGSQATVKFVNAVGEYDLGWASLLGTYSDLTGGTINAAPFNLFGGAYPASFEAGPSDGHRERVGEVRLVTRLGGAWNGVAGLYYDHQEDKDFRTYFWHGDPATDLFAPGGPNFLGFFNVHNFLAQKAAFGEVTWEILPGLTLLGGTRYYHYSRDDHGNTGGGALIGPDTSASYNSAASGVVGRANLSYKLTGDALLYGGWSQGFRLGRVGAPLSAASCRCSKDGVYIYNIVDGMFTTSTGIPLASTGIIESDSVNSYEVGGKFGLFNRRLTIDADLFLTDWSNVPLSAIAGIAAYLTNGGNARSRGVEFEAHYQLTDALRADLGGSWLKAYLTKTSPNISGAAVGDRLPGSPQVNANLGLQYAFDIASHAAFVRADAMYVGSFYSDLLSSPTLKAGGYATVNATAGVAVKKLNVDFYVHNLTDRNSFTFRGPFASFGGENFGYRLRPRTIGIQLEYPF